MEMYVKVEWSALDLIESQQIAVIINNIVYNSHCYYY